MNIHFAITAMAGRLQRDFSTSEYLSSLCSCSGQEIATHVHWQTDNKGAFYIKKKVQSVDWWMVNGEWWIGEDLERRGRVLFGVQLCNCLYEFRKITINQCHDNRCEIVGFRRGVLRPSLFCDFKGRRLVVDDQRFGTGCRSHLQGSSRWNKYLAPNVGRQHCV